MASANQPDQQSRFEREQDQLAAILAPLVAVVVSHLAAGVYGGGERSLQVALRRFTVHAGALVQEYGRQSVQQAFQWYLDDRPPGKAPLFRLPKPPSVAVVAAKLDIAELLEAPVVTPQVVQQVTDSVTGTVEQVVLGLGDQTVIKAIKEDPKAVTWARGLEPGFCAFCGMLATRGAVYKSEAPAAMKVHLHCRCYPIAIYAGQRYTPGLREQRAGQLWAQSTSGVPTAQKLRAFRAALEGRPFLPNRATSPHSGAPEGQLSKDMALGQQRRDELITDLRQSEKACKAEGLLATLRQVRSRINQLEQANRASRAA